MELVRALPAILAARRALGEDDALLDRFAAARRGDPDALAALYDELAAELHGFALWRSGCRAAADDAVQEVFCRLAAGRAPDSEQVRSPRAWLLAAVRRAVIDLHRRRRREVAFEAADFELPADESGREDPARRSDGEGARRALAALPPKLREALYLRHFAGLSFAEIGRVAGVPTFTAASRCRLGLARLRRAFRVEAAT
jgi:RNA polymerase sigma-70 factor (ECF subfamily)